MAPPAAPARRAFSPLAGPNSAPPVEGTRWGGWWSRLTRGFRKLLWQGAWQTHLGDDWPDRILDLPVTDRYFAKQGRSVGRLILDENGERLSVYLKRHYRLPRRHGLLATLFPHAAWSPGWEEARHLRWASENGIPVPEVIAAGEFNRPGGRLQSFLAIRELEDMLPLHEAIPLASRALAPHAFARWKKGLAREMARLARLLHDRRHFHKDLYLCHFYIPRAFCEHPPETWTDIVHMIDFHRLAHHPWTWRWYRIKDLGQLLYSSAVEGVTPRDRLWFWRAYAGPRTTHRLLARLVRLRGGLYRQHNQKRKGGVISH